MVKNSISDTVNLLVQHIEDSLGWGSASTWTTRDYEQLSVAIFNQTRINISVATLKRVFGRVKYDSKPAIATLDTLAKFIGYHDFRSFQIVQSSTVKTPSGFNTRKLYTLFLGIVFLMVVAVGFWLFTRVPSHQQAPPSIKNFKFSSKTIVDVGVPNSVIFEYDASAASVDDSIFIQQSWDERLKSRVSYKEQQHTSIYYYPGYFDAKLVVNNEVVREHPIFIKTDGWMAIIEQVPIPIYMHQDSVRKDGLMTITLDEFKKVNVPLQPTVPWVQYSYMSEFKDVTSSDAAIKTIFKNDYAVGSGICQNSQIRIQFKGAAMIIPLSTKNCVASLNFRDFKGNALDPTSLGCDFSNWVTVVTTLNDGLATIQVNNHAPITFDLPLVDNPIVGIGFRFQGTGSVKYTSIKNKEGEIFFEDHFQ